MSTSLDPAHLAAFLASTEADVLQYLTTAPANGFLHPPEFRDAVWSYVDRKAKRLRPAVLLMACGSVGGKLEAALPAAAGVELFHTWTLVHDDLIDNDTLRRGGPTVHAAVSSKHRRDFPALEHRSAEYGRDIAILTGDMQHGWSVASFLEPALKYGVEPKVVLKIVHHLQTSVLGRLIEGEILDVQYAVLGGMDWTAVTDDEVVNMLWLKTGVLYEFAAMAGAMIGLETDDADEPRVAALRNFCKDCGIAFQLQDDILGVVGDEATLGKPVGSDIREGKKTLIVLEALRRASAAQRAKLLSILGNPHSTSDEIAFVADLLRELGGIERTQRLALEHVNRARPWLDTLPATKYRDLLLSWADYMVARTF